MKALIKRYQSVFGAILLAGCICGGYLLCMGIGLQLQLIFPPISRGDEPYAVYLLVMIPMLGAGAIVVAAAFYKTCAYVFRGARTVFAVLFSDLKFVCDKLGTWLVDKINAS